MRVLVSWKHRRTGEENTRNKNRKKQKESIEGTKRRTRKAEKSNEKKTTELDQNIPTPSTRRKKKKNIKGREKVRKIKGDSDSQAWMKKKKKSGNKKAYRNRTLSP